MGVRGVRNILLIMCDQLRADYLSCYGHPGLSTPHIDWLASVGTQFTRCYSQAPVCGPSRMSFYTGRYAFSHGATWNQVPLAAGERTLGDYLRATGLRTAVCGKTHAVADVEGIGRVGLDPRAGPGRLIAEAGFEPYARHDGLVPDHFPNPSVLPYNAFLRARGYGGRNPWHDFANSGESEAGIASGWRMRNAGRAARVAEEHSETAWATDCAMAFIKEQGERPWCLHLSYIKPHWPYLAPAPYHALYGPEDVAAPLRTARERDDGHPVYRAFREHPEGVAFSSEEVRRTVVPTYMGLVKQVDHHVGRLLRLLHVEGRLQDTCVVFTSDHGDFLGDHWLGEKEAFFEQSVRIPLIMYDPSAGVVRGGRCDGLVEAIDLVPTFIDLLGQPIPGHALEGRSLMGVLRGGPAPEREAVFSELDYSFYGARRALGLGPQQARAVMVRTRDAKLVHYDNFPPQLYDLVNDPLELEDLGVDPGKAGARGALYELLFTWMRRRRNRTTLVDAGVLGRSAPDSSLRMPIGQW
jgi:arylsulfatase A-like enzyme